MLLYKGKRSANPLEKDCSMKNALKSLIPVVLVIVFAVAVAHFWAVYTAEAAQVEHAERVELGVDFAQYQRFSKGVVKELKWVHSTNGTLNLQMAVVTITDDNRTLDRAVFLTQPVKIGEKVTVGYYYYGTVAGSRPIPFIVQPDGKG
jgi:hypothetical protein